jgi:hypothetical protein
LPAEKEELLGPKIEVVFPITTTTKVSKGKRSDQGIKLWVLNVAMLYVGVILLRVIF